MPLGEFDLIAKYFTRPARRSPLGVGDDCALLAPGPGQQLAVSTDLLVEGRHFVSTVAPERLGHKALAVNLSDLAACGARPLAYTLALALPQPDEDFLAGFARGLHALADAHAVELVGGDTTGGPLAVCITVFGEVPPGQALLRSGARPGDELWVSHPRGGGLGDARLALEMWRGAVAVTADLQTLRDALERPQPRVALGLALRGVASAAIDLSDGLVGDLGHLLQRSGVGALVEADALPRSAALAAQPLDVQHQCLLAGGDDYELLFSAAPGLRAAVLAAGEAGAVALTRIGRIVATPGLQWLDAEGRALPGRWAAFDHFAAR